MKNIGIPILGFAAHSGTGKTTLLTQLIPLLINAGLRVGLIKHSHHNFEIDKPGKDSYRLREAGASPVMLVSSHRRATITEFTKVTEPRLFEQIKAMDTSNLDLILVEGFKAECFPKIELHRPSLNNKLFFPNDPNIIAIATDIVLSVTAFNSGIPETELSSINHPPKLDLNNPVQISSFILHSFLKGKKEGIRQC